MSRTFFGREQELKQLRQALEAAASPDADPRGPRIVFVVAETGYGKSRLVQELYHDLTQDPKWDPPESDFWPDTFGDRGEELSVNPSMSGHQAKGLPRFLWLGMRWHPTDVRNVADRRSALPDLKSTIDVQEAVARDLDSLLQKAGRKLRSADTGALAKAALSAAADQISGGSVLIWCAKLAKVAKDTLDRRAKGPMDHDRAAEEAAKDIHEVLLEQFRAMMDGRGGIPVVLWLDDAQWIDSLSLEFLRRLWRTATVRNWPLCVVATHWEREWRELHALPEEERQGTLVHYAETWPTRTTEVRLGKARDEDLRRLVQQHLPGLTKAQAGMLLGKADGNYLSMLENLGSLRQEPGNFLDEDLRKGFSASGETEVASWESDRQKRIEQRFRKLEKRVKNLLGWSSQLGVRFLHGVVSDYAQRVAREERPDQLFALCEDPLVILATANPWMREFRDKAFHLEAAKYFRTYGVRESGKLSEVLREHLTQWVQRSFGADGAWVEHDGDDPSSAPESSVLRLLLEKRSEELRDLLDIARREIPLPRQTDWTREADVVALRVFRVSIKNDAESNLWDRVREAGKALEGIDWSTLSADVLGDRALERMADRLDTAGLPWIALRMREQVVRMRERMLTGGWAEEEAADDLRRALNDLGDSLQTAGRYEEALRMFRHASQIAAARMEKPGTPESRREFAGFLKRVAGIEEERGDLVAALSKHEECLAIARELASEFGTPESRRDVMISLASVAGIEQERGDLDSALSKYEESLTIARALASELRTPESRRDLSLTLYRVAGIEHQRGDLDAALSKCKESLVIARALASEFGTPQSIGDLSTSLVYVARIEQELGDMAAALSNYEESLSIRRELASDLGTPSSRRGVSFSLRMVAGIEETRGDLEGALPKYKECLAIDRELASEFGTPESRRDVMISLGSVAGIEEARGDLEGALSKYEECLAIARGLASEFGTPRSRRDVGVSLDAVARLEKERGDLGGALQKYEECLAIARALASELDTPLSRRDVSASLDSLGWIEQARGNLKGALAKYEESLSIARVVALELGTPDSRRDLASSLGNVAGIDEARGDMDAALSKYEEGLSICRELCRETSETEDINGYVLACCNIAKIQLAKGDPTSAFAALTTSADSLPVLEASSISDHDQLDTAATWHELASKTASALGETSRAEREAALGLSLRERSATLKQDD